MTSTLVIPNIATAREENLMSGLTGLVLVVMLVVVVVVVVSRWGWLGVITGWGRGSQGLDFDESSLHLSYSSYVANLSLRGCKGALGCYAEWRAGEGYQGGRAVMVFWILQTHL